MKNFNKLCSQDRLRKNRENVYFNMRYSYSDQFFEAAWDTDDMLDYLGGNPFAQDGEVCLKMICIQNSLFQDASFGDEDFYMNPEMEAILANYADIIYSDGKNKKIKILFQINNFIIK